MVEFTQNIVGGINMGKAIYYCESCNKTGENNKNLDLQYFTNERLNFKRGYIYEKSCNGNTKICPYCNGELIKADISEEDYILLGNASNDNRQLLDAMVDLHKKDIIEYELKMSQFKKQYEQEKQQKRQESSNNVPKCPTCKSTNVEKISLGKKAVGGALFGLFSSNIRNTMHCKNCGAKW